jgi:hypothetical protein
MELDLQNGSYVFLATVFLYAILRYFQRHHKLNIDVAKITIASAVTTVFIILMTNYQKEEICLEPFTS